MRANAVPRSWSLSLPLLTLSLLLLVATATVPHAGAAETKSGNHGTSKTVAGMAALTVSGGAVDANANTNANTDDEPASHALIEENPDYAGEASDDEEDWSESDESESEEELDDDNDDAKTRVSETLKKRTKAKGRRGTTVTALAGVVRKHRSRITLALALFAFRSELWKVARRLSERHSSETAVTDVLKLVLFVDCMRRLQAGGGKDSAGLLKLLGRVSPLLGILIEKTMNHNPAYVPPISQHFAFESLNEYYLKDGMALHKAIHTRHEGFKWPTSSTPSICPDFAASKKDTKRVNATTNVTVASKNEGEDDSESRTVVVLDWTKLDTSITSLEVLRQQIAFLLSEYRSLGMTTAEAPAARSTVQRSGESDSNFNSNSNADSDSETTTPQTPPSPAPLEVVVLLESPGGSVSEYGLAGQHLLRLRNEPGITLTICVDKVAASGGYLLCCTASPGQLFAAPFALLGSIGVIGTQINVHKLLTDKGIEPLEFRGGRDKAPIGLLGPVSKEGKRTTQAMIDQTHEAFKQHVANARPALRDTIDEIGNGNVWLGVDALDLKLVDALRTSDEYIEQQLRKGSRVFKMVQIVRSSGFLLGPRITSSAQTAEFEKSFLKDHRSPSAVEDDLGGLIQRSGPWMARFSVHRWKSLVSKTLQSFLQ